MELEQIKALIRDVPDFPKPGIIFKDITPILQNPQALKATIRLLLESLPHRSFEVVAGVESRGFILGPILAAELGAGFVPVRKKGKLPARTFSASYELEYGLDTLELHADAIAPGQEVLVHDDLLATGGTARATCNLVTQCGGHVGHLAFLVALDFLKGQNQLADYSVNALLRY